MKFWRRSLVKLMQNADLVKRVGARTKVLWSRKIKKADE